MQNRFLDGARPSGFDGRDLEYTNLAAVAVASEVRLHHGVPVRDQHDVPCCVSMAVTACMEILDSARGSVIELAPLFNYFYARPNPSDFRPLDLRAALQAATELGICARALHDVEYDEAGACTRPSDEAREDARKHQLAGYDPTTRTMRYELITSNRTVSCRTALSRGFPVLIALWMTSGYLNLSAERPVHARPPAEPSVGGHAVVAVGYDDQRASFIIEDSRGPNFAQGGSWFLPYDILDSRIVYEAWILRELTYDT